MDPSTELFERIGLSVALGLLIGLQREATGAEFAGLRSVALVTLFGTLSGLLAGHFGGWVIVAGLFAITTLLVLGNVMQWRGRVADVDPAISTEIALLTMYGLGAYIAFGSFVIAVVIAGVVVVLLHFRQELHSLVGHLAAGDLRAIMQFVLITFVVLPVLPDRTFGPLDVFNPFEVWLMVTLIVGISVAGYLLYKVFGGGAGVLLGGALGGAVSSTATTLAYARQAREGLAAGLAAVAVTLASGVTFVRVALEVGVVAPRLLPAVALPLGIMFALTLGGVGLAWLRVRQKGGRPPLQQNPAELGPAVTMAALYALVLVVLAAAKAYLGSDALYVVSVVAGLSDVDAVTLSIARLANAGVVAEDAAWRLVLTGVLSNTVFKVLLAGSIGGRALLVRVLALAAPAFAAGVALLLLLPASGAQ